MNAGDWIAVASPGLLVAGAVIAATAKMTRLTVAVETLTKAVTGALTLHGIGTAGTVKISLSATFPLSSGSA